MTVPARLLKLTHQVCHTLGELLFKPSPIKQSAVPQSVSGGGGATVHTGSGGQFGESSDAGHIQTLRATTDVRVLLCVVFSCLVALMAFHASAEWV